MLDPEQESKLQNWISSTQSLDKGDYGDGTFGGFLFGDDTESPGKDYNDYTREVLKRESGKTHISIKSDPALAGIQFRCGHNNCQGRILIGIRNSSHSKYTTANVNSVGWTFSEATSTFRCEEHRHEVQALDVLRDRQGRPLMAQRTFSFTYTVNDIYDPDIDGTVEVCVDGTYTLEQAEPDEGIMCDYPTEITVTATDSGLFDVSAAQRMLHSREGEKYVEKYISCDWDDDYNEGDY